MGCRQCKRNRIGTIVEDKSNEVNLTEGPITAAPQMIRKVTSPPMIRDREASSKSQPSVKQDDSKNKSSVAPANEQEPAELVTTKISLGRVNYPESFSESISTSSHSSSWTDCSDETTEPTIQKPLSSSRAQSSRVDMFGSTVPKRLLTESISSVSSDSKAPDSDFRPNRSSTPHSEAASSSVNAYFIFSPRRPSVFDSRSDRTRSQASMRPNRNIPLLQTAISPMPNSPRIGVTNTPKFRVRSPNDLVLQPPDEITGRSSQPSMAEQRMTVTSRAMHEIVVRAVQSASSKLSKSDILRKSRLSESSSQSDEI